MIDNSIKATFYSNLERYNSHLQRNRNKQPFIGFYSKSFPIKRSPLSKNLHSSFVVLKNAPNHLATIKLKKHPCSNKNLVSNRQFRSYRPECRTRSVTWIIRKRNSLKNSQNSSRKTRLPRPLSLRNVLALKK